jgi:hypothetical protein
MRASDLNRLFWTKLCEKMSLERSLCHAEEEFSAEQIVVLLR